MKFYTKVIELGPEEAFEVNYTKVKALGQQEAYEVLCKGQQEAYEVLCQATLNSLDAVPRSIVCLLRMLAVLRSTLCHILSWKI